MDVLDQILFGLLPMPMPPPGNNAARNRGTLATLFTRICAMVSARKRRRRLCDLGDALCLCAIGVLRRGPARADGELCQRMRETFTIVGARYATDAVVASVLSILQHAQAIDLIHGVVELTPGGAQIGLRFSNGIPTRGFTRAYAAQEKTYDFGFVPHARGEMIWPVDA